MDTHELASAMRRIADVFDKLENVKLAPGKPMLNESIQPGAAAMLIYLRDCFTVARKEVYTRDEILVILNTIQTDRELFTADVVSLMDKISSEEDNDD